MGFRDFLSGQPLGKPGLHGVQFRQCGSTECRVAGAVFGDEFLDEVGAFEDDAAPGVAGAEFAEIAEESAVPDGGIDAAGVSDVFCGELDDGAGFDVAAWVDVMADAGGHGAEGAALAVVGRRPPARKGGGGIPRRSHEGPLGALFLHSIRRGKGNNKGNIRI